jgi:Protein of unknown function (DUF2865)
MMFFSQSTPRSGITLASTRPSRIITLLAGAVIFAGAGSLIVCAADGPDMIRVLREFNHPNRAPAEARNAPPLPKIFLPQVAARRQGSQPLSPHVLSFAPAGASFQPVPRALPAPLLPAPLLQAPRLQAPRLQAPLSPEPSAGGETSGNPYLPRRVRSRTSPPAEGAGSAVATNYCVRLCDGFAFPVGHASGSWGVQEATCRAACPGADTLLYSAPAGAKDFDALSRNGSPYSALPAAFRYRQKITNACTCRAIGATQSASAVLRDLTLKPGDLVMTRAGTRHFDGAERFPYRPAAFSDAIARLTVKREVAIVRAMDLASLREGMTSSAPPTLRARVVTDSHQAERVAARARPIESARNLPRGFVILQAREKLAPLVLHGVKRPAGIVALN